MNTVLRRNLQRLADVLAAKTGDDDWSTVDLDSLYTMGIDTDRSVEENADALLSESVQPRHVGQRSAEPSAKKPRAKTSKKRLDADLIEHACMELGRAASRHFEAGFTAASAAERAIKETKALFPSDWKLAVQGDSRDSYVEVWETSHKRTIPCANVGEDSGRLSHATRKLDIKFGTFGKPGSVHAEDSIDILVDGKKVGWIERVKDERFASASSRARIAFVSHYEIMFTDDALDAKAQAADRIQLVDTLGDAKKLVRNIITREEVSTPAPEGASATHAKKRTRT